MKPTTKRTQNKVRREDAKGQLVAELKQQNNQLKKLVGRLKKELNRLDCLTSEEEEFKEPEFIKEAEFGLLCCEGCGKSNLFEMNLPNGKTLTICKTCKAVVR